MSKLYYGPALDVPNRRHSPLRLFGGSRRVKHDRKFVIVWPDVTGSKSRGALRTPCVGKGPETYGLTLG